MNISFLSRTVVTCVLAVASCCMAAENDIIPTDNTRVFKSQTPFILSYVANGGSVSEFVCPQEKTPEGSRISGVFELIRVDEDSDYDEHTYLCCYCKRKDGFYERYYIIAPFDTAKPLVFHSTYEVSGKQIIGTTKAKDGNISLEFETYKMPDDLARSQQKGFDVRKGDEYYEESRACLLEISRAYAQGGRKAVKTLLGDRLDRGKSDSKADKQSESTKPAPAAPKHSEKSAAKGEQAHHVQNNLSDSVTVGATKAAVVKQGYGYTTLAWMVEVTNKSKETIPFLSIEHKTLNADELQLNYSLENIENLKPGETRKVKGQEMMEDAQWEKAASHEFEIE